MEESAWEERELLLPREERTSERGKGEKTERVAGRRRT